MSSNLPKKRQKPRSDILPHQITDYGVGFPTHIDDHLGDSTDCRFYSGNVKVNYKDEYYYLKCRMNAPATFFQKISTKISGG